ncbi:MAG: hypothetical protein ACR2MG_02500 [Pyrinomonadaceae bacterium]
MRETLELIAESKGKYVVGLKDASKAIEETDKSGNGKSSNAIQKSWSRKRTRTNRNAGNMNSMTFWRWKKTQDGKSVKSKR